MICMINFMKRLKMQRLKGGNNGELPQKTP